MNHIQLYEKAKDLASITESEWEEFSQSFQEGRALKGDVLVRPGEEAKYIWIVLRGIIRNYDLDDKGKEYTKVFRGPGEYIGSYTEILIKTKTRFFVQSVTDSDFLRLPYTAFESMMDKYKSWERLGRLMAEMNYLEKEKREYNLMRLTAEERYNVFMEQYGELANSIPQYQIASNLAISPEALSRLIKTRSKIL